MFNYQFPGKTLREKTAGPFRITETRYAANATLPRHQHEAAYLSFLFAGGYSELAGVRETRCDAGTVLWHPAYDVHEDRFHADGGHMLNLEISDSWLSETAQELKLSGELRAFRGGLPFSAGLRLYRELEHDGCSADDLAHELVSFFFNGPMDARPPLWFVRTLDFLQDEFDRSLSLRDAARRAGVHPVHLARSFRRFVGCSFGDYVAKVRVRHAFRLLPATRYSIADVAHAAGFADHAHLCRTFKQLTGFTPTAFRRHMA